MIKVQETLKKPNMETILEEEDHEANETNEQMEAAQLSPDVELGHLKTVKVLTN